MQHSGIVEVSRLRGIVFGAGFYLLKNIVLAALFELFVREIGLKVISPYMCLRRLVEVLCPVCFLFFFKGDHSSIAVDLLIDHPF